MIKKLIKSLSDRKERKEQVEKEKEEKILIKKVERGTDLVIQKYGDALRKLGAYDRQ